MDGVCAVAGYVGRELAPHVRKHGGKLLPESMKKDKDGRSNIDGAMVVAASGVQGRGKIQLISSPNGFDMQAVFYLCQIFKWGIEGIDWPSKCFRDLIVKIC